MTTYSALYYHIVWATKGRTPSILKKIEAPLHAYISGIIKATNAQAIQVGGMPDHIHILARIKPDQNIPELVKIIKTSSSRWLKEQNREFSDFS